MKLGISIKIDVTKIDKSRIVVGKKGKYIDLTTFVDTEKEDQYGNHGFISQSVTKEEREQGIQTAILGNSKIFYGLESKPDRHQRPTEQARQQADDDFGSDIPF